MRVLINDVPNHPHAQAGQVLDLPDAEAKDMITRGTAVAVPDALAAPAPLADAGANLADDADVAADPEPEVVPARVRSRRPRATPEPATRRGKRR